MKVLFVTHCTTMAGANRSLLQLILELRNDYGIEPFVLLPPQSGENYTFRNYLQSEGIRYRESPIPYFKLPLSIRIIRNEYYQYFRELSHLCKELKQMKFDIVHSNSSAIDFGGYISRIIGAKHVWHFREFGDLDYDLYSIWGKLYEKLTYKNSDAFIAISEAVRKHHEGILDTTKLHTIYNGIKPKVKELHATHNNGKVKFLCAGLICESKNQLEIIKAVNILVNKRNVCNFSVTLVGIRAGNYIEELESYVKEHGLGGNVSFMEEVDSIEKLASTMDVGIMSSNCEAFGRVTVEYMMQDLAVIANDKGANPEIITDGETGLIYHHNSAEDLADKMQSLIEDNSLLVRLAERGYHIAMNDFPSSKNTRSIFDLYNHLLSTPKNKPANIYTSSAYWIMQFVHIKDIISYRICSIKTSCMSK